MPKDHPELPYIGMEDLESETMRLLGTRPAGEMKSSSEYFRPDDVLYGRLRPYLNKVYRPDFEGLCSAEFIVFRKTPHVESKYIQYFLNQWSFVAFINQQNTGDRPRVKFEQMADYPFPLPPFPEQQRIITEIEKQFTRLDAAVAGLKRVKAELERYKASVLKAACEGRLVPQDPDDEPADKLLARILAERRRQWEEDGRKGKYQEPERSDVAGLPDLPAGWVWTNLSQLKQFSLYGPRFSSNDYTDAGYLVLRTSDISEYGKVDYSSAPKLALSDEDFEKYRCEIGDLLITRTGSLGTLAIFNDSVGAIPGAYLIQYRLVIPDIIPWYVYYFLRTPEGQARLVGGGAGVGRPNLNAPTIESIPIPLPPLAQQQRIVDEIERRMSTVQAVEQEIDANLTRANRLRQSILQQAFSGRLVPQQPDDEPASALLARIGARRDGVERPRRSGRAAGAGGNDGRAYQPSLFERERTNRE